MYGRLYVLRLVGDELNGLRVSRQLNKFFAYLWFAQIMQKYIWEFVTVYYRTRMCEALEGRCLRDNSSALLHVCSFADGEGVVDPRIGVRNDVI